MTMTMKVSRLMALWSLMSVLMLIGRLFWSGNISYIFLPWNLFLAWIPFWFSIALSNSVNEGGGSIKRMVLLGSWLLFFPNAPYILTDLFHLRIRPGVPLWFDLILILSFAINGLMLGYASLFKVRKVLLTRFSEKLVDLFVMALIVLCSFGVYLGRYPRYNSWDLLTDPVGLFSDILNMLFHPLSNTRMVGVTFFFSLFLMAGYWTINTLLNYHRDERSKTI